MVGEQVVVLLKTSGKARVYRLFLDSASALVQRQRDLRGEKACHNSRLAEREHIDLKIWSFIMAHLNWTEMKNLTSVPWTSYGYSVGRI